MKELLFLALAIMVFWSLTREQKSVPCAADQLMPRTALVRCVTEARQ